VIAPTAQAYLGDPLVPHPPHWCPGNDDPNTVGLLRTAGFCEGQSFPDGRAYEDPLAIPIEDMVESSGWRRSLR
jgi:hypothetical protein